MAPSGLMWFMVYDKASGQTHHPIIFPEGGTRALYSLIDHSCTFSPPKKFRITQDSNDLVLTIITGDGTFTAGDIFQGERLTGYGQYDGQYIASFPNLYCEGTIVQSPGQAEYLQETFRINVEIGNLFTWCEDENSADYLCTLSYAVQAE